MVDSFQFARKYNNLQEIFLIRRMVDSDIQFFNKLRNECCKFLHDTNEYSLDESHRWFKNTKSFFFILEVNNEKIGYFRTSLLNIEEQNSVYFGFDIIENLRGKGYARFVYPYFLKFLKENYKIEHFYARVTKFNQRALHFDLTALHMRIIEETEIDYKLYWKYNENDIIC